MTERPILFSAPMVRALLAGTKTQTRRVATPRRSIEPMTDECPYGQPGDRLWVRETWSAHSAGGFMYAASWDAHALIGHPKWRPSIHMPRAASRITLEVTGVRVERLQEITRGDAMAEGCPFPNMAAGHDPREWYAKLWNDINGPGSWDANPWVWAITFRRVDSATTTRN